MSNSITTTRAIMAFICRGKKHTDHWWDTRALKRRLGIPVTRLPAVWRTAEIARQVGHWRILVLSENSLDTARLL